MEARSDSIGAAMMVAIAMYIAVSFIIFGDPLSPLVYLTLRSDRLGAPAWQMIVLASIGVAFWMSFLRSRTTGSGRLRAGAFVATSMIVAVVLVGTYASALRHIEIRRFAPDYVMTNSFFESLHMRSNDANQIFFAHAAALKGCVHYAWSWRTMGFYILNDRTAPNVSPKEFLNLCPVTQP